MVEKHYAHLAPSQVADTIRANLPTFDGMARSQKPRVSSAKVLDIRERHRRA